MMFVRITVCLLNSHQSTFGRPVTPAAFRTRVGLTASISAATASLFSNLASPKTTSSPAALMSSMSMPPIQPFLP